MRYKTDEEIQDEREEARQDAPTRRSFYRCGDRTCGGLDCASCYSESAASQYMAEQEEKDYEETMDRRDKGD